MRRFFLIIFMVLAVGAPLFLFGNFSNAKTVENQIVTQYFTDAVAGKQGAGYGKPKDPRMVAAQVVQISMGTLGIVFVCFMVYAGFLILASAGEEEKIAKGKRTIKFAVIGCLLALSAFSVSLFLEKYMRGAFSPNSINDPFFSSTEFDVQEDTSGFYNDDPLGQDVRGDMDAWNDTDWSKWK